MFYMFKWKQVSGVTTGFHLTYVMEVEIIWNCANQFLVDQPVYSS